MLGLLFLWIYLPLGAASALYARFLGDRIVGEVIFATKAPRAPRIVMSAGLVLLGIAVALTLDADPGGGIGGSLLLIELTLALLVIALWCLPQNQDGAVGTEGVRSGWSCSSFSQIESWRLTGDHLRYCVGGRWRAFQVPLQAQPTLRAVLLEQAAHAEAEFQ